MCRSYSGEEAREARSVSAMVPLRRNDSGPSGGNNYTWRYKIMSVNMWRTKAQGEREVREKQINEEQREPHVLAPKQEETSVPADPNIILS